MDNLDVRISQLLEAGPNTSAAEMARSLGVPRTTVNSHLYRGLGALYAITGDAPPLWHLAEHHASAQKPVSHPVPRVFSSQPVHVDFAGGDWELRVGIRPSSRNDPIAVVERLGPRIRAVLVSDYVAQAEDHGDTLDTAVLTVAASVLAWEISEHLRQVHSTVDFDFARASRDVYLSLTAHARRSVTAS